jgi:hypothetical protein
MSNQKSDAETYPELLPEGLTPLDTLPFRFNPKNSKKSLEDIKNQVEAIESRISQLARREELQIQGIPVLQHLISLSQNKDELRFLGKALLRVAELMPELEDLKKQQLVLEVAEDNPRWLMATFGDFSEEIDEAFPGEEIVE